MARDFYYLNGATPRHDSYSERQFSDTYRQIKLCLFYKFAKHNNIWCLFVPNFIQFSPANSEI